MSASICSSSGVFHNNVHLEILLNAFNNMFRWTMKMKCISFILFRFSISVLKWSCYHVEVMCGETNVMSIVKFFHGNVPFVYGYCSVKRKILSHVINWNWWLLFVVVGALAISPIWTLFFIIKSSDVIAFWLDGI
jgi:hypothetical protein